MRRLTLITTLLLGASTTVALADPKWVPHDRWGNDQRDPDVYGHDYDRSYDDDYVGPRDYRYNRGVVKIADHWRANSNRQFITVGPNFGRFRTLFVRAERGPVAIHQIAIDYFDGTTQVVKPVLFSNGYGYQGRGGGYRRGGNEARIDLNGRGRAIKRIVVYTDPTHGAYSIYGR